MPTPFMMNTVRVNSEGGIMWIKQKYLMLFYSACGKPSQYISRSEQINNAYWLVSLMQGVNLASIFFIYNFINPTEGLSILLFFGFMIIPFIWNYFIFLRQGNAHILKEINELISKGQLKSKAYMIKYIILTIIFLALTGLLNNDQIQSFFGIG